MEDESPVDQETHRKAVARQKPEESSQVSNQPSSSAAKSVQSEETKRYVQLKTCPFLSPEAFALVHSNLHKL